MTRAVLFDIDGVIVDSAKGNAAMYRDLLGKFGYTGPTDEEHTTRNHYTFIDNIRHFAKGASEDEIQKIYQYGSTHQRGYDLMILADGVNDALGHLQPLYSLGVVSSRLHIGIGSLLDHFGIGRFFPVRIGFEDTKEHKPHPAPLLAGAENLEVKPSEIVYIGDAESDIEAAKAAGMKMIHYSLETLPGDHATVSKFSDIPTVIRSM